MKAHIWLTLNQHGILKATKAAPSLAPKQRAVRLTIQVPDSAFAEPPTLDAQLDIPAEALAYPAVTEAARVEIWGP